MAKKPIKMEVLGDFGGHKSAKSNTEKSLISIKGKFFTRMDTRGLGRKASNIIGVEGSLDR